MYKLIFILIIPFISAFLGYYIGTKNEKKRDVFNIIISAINFLFIILIYPDLFNGNLEYSVPHVMGTGLHLKIDIFRYSFIFISGFAWFITTLYSTQYLIKYKNRNRYYMFFMLTYSFTLGIFMSDNILNLFTFFEGMSLTSYALIIHDEDKYSHEAGVSYLSMAIAGGMVLLMGIFLAYDASSSLEIDEMAKIIPYISDSKKYLIAGLLIFGFGIKASMFPLHTWLPKAYAAAPAPATAIISAILLKTGVFGIIITLNVLLNSDLLISYILFSIGLVNIIFGGILAIMQRNIKRIIAYSSMSQTGFIFLGIALIGILGEHGGIAMAGTIMYILNHAFFKLLLFLGAGIIYMILREMSLNYIWGFGKDKWRLKIIFAIGLLGIIGFPGLSGFISKTIIHESILEAYHLTGNSFFKLSEYLFFFGGGLTVAYMLKLFIAIFMTDNEKYKGEDNSQIKKRALFPLTLVSVVIVLIGLFPQKILSAISIDSLILDYHVPEHIKIFTLESLISSLITISIGILIYSLFVNHKICKKVSGGYIFSNPSLTWFNLEENLYKPLSIYIYINFGKIFKLIDNWVLNSASNILKISTIIGNIDMSNFDKLKFEKKLFSKEDINNIYNNIQKSKDEGKVVKSKIEDKIDKSSQNFKETISNINFKITNITYSVFLFGVVLVISFVFIFLKSSGR